MSFCVIFVLSLELHIIMAGVVSCIQKEPLHTSEIGEYPVYIA